jgi:hypothetical protein
MIKNLTLLLAFVCTTLSPVNAQQTGDEIFVIDIKIDGVTTTYKNGTGGFSAPADWGGPILGDICAEAVWGYGRIVSSQVMRDFQSGQIRMDTRNLAFGHCALSIRSSEEGAAITNLMICH